MNTPEREKFEKWWQEDKWGEMTLTGIGLKLVALDAWQAALSGAPIGDIAVITDENGDAVGVVRQDKNGMVLSTIWVRSTPSAPTPPEVEPIGYVNPRIISILNKKSSTDATIGAIKTTIYSEPIFSSPPSLKAETEVEPVFAAMDYKTQEYAYIRTSKRDVESWITLQHQSRDDVTYFLVELFTSPPSPKADEERS